MDWPWVCTLRTRTGPGRPGRSETEASGSTVPESRVPVTTVPKPLRVKARSMGRNSGPSAGRRWTDAEALACARRDWNHLRRLQHAAGDHRGQVGVEEAPPVLAQPREEVGLAEGDDSRPDAEQLADVEVLAGLGHDALVGGDDQDGQIHPAGTGGHGLHEALVAGHVHHPGNRSIGQGEVGEAQLEGDAPPLLLRQPVGVDAGEGLHQRGLAVVDVPGGADDHVECLDRCAVSQARRQRPKRDGAHEERAAEACPSARRAAQGWSLRQREDRPSQRSVHADRGI
jgi:hypothetical protein